MSKSHRTSRWLKKLLLRRAFVALLLLAQIVFIGLNIAFYSQLRWFSILWQVIGFFTALHLTTHSQHNATFKISMVFLILLFPVFGAVFYCFFHYQTTTIGYRKRLHKKEQETAHAFGFVPDMADTASIENPDAGRMIRYLRDVSGFPVCGNTETEYYDDGKAYQAALLKALRSAEKYIFMEYFIIGEGVFWDSIHEILREKAAAGVDVRLIWDDIGCLLTLPTDFAASLRKEGIQCVVFNPFRPFLSSVQNNRDHRKITSVDGKVAFTGGINLADEYINERERFGHWKDAGIRLEGDGAWSFTVMFLQMWSFLTKQTEDCAKYLPERREPAPEGTRGWVQPFCDSPMDELSVGEHTYRHLIATAKNYVYITTPYLMVDNDLISTLKLAAESGVDVRILTPHKPDKKIVHFTTRSYYRELLHSGVRIFEYTDGFIHSKNFVVDDRLGSVGTVNMDFRSLYMHFECGVCLYGTDSLAEVKRDFLETQEKCMEITAKTWRANPLVAFLQDICRLFAPML